MYKEPCVIVGKQSKSDFLINKGNYKFKMTLPKNVFFYDEKIPYEIDLDCTNLGLILSSLEISLQRIRKKGNQLKYFHYEEIKSFLIKIIKVNRNKKIGKYKGELYFPKKSSEDKNIYPPSIYELIEKEAPHTEIDNFQRLYHFSPCSRGELVIVEYYLKIKLVFENVFTSDEYYLIPIDFCSRPENQKINNNQNSINSVDQNVKSNIIEKPKESNLQITEKNDDQNNNNNNDNKEINVNLDEIPPPPPILNNNNDCMMNNNI